MIFDTIPQFQLGESTVILGTDLICLTATRIRKVTQGWISTFFSQFKSDTIPSSWLVFFTRSNRRENKNQQLMRPFSSPTDYSVPFLGWRYDNSKLMTTNGLLIHHATKFCYYIKTYYRVLYTSPFIIQ